MKITLKFYVIHMLLKLWRMDFKKRNCSWFFEFLDYITIPLWKLQLVFTLNIFIFNVQQIMWITLQIS